MAWDEGRPTLATLLSGVRRDWGVTSNVVLHTPPSLSRNLTTVVTHHPRMHPDTHIVSVVVTRTPCAAQDTRSVITVITRVTLPAPFLCAPRHGDFVSRYKILLPPEQQDMVLASPDEMRAAVLRLLAVFKVTEGQYEMGKTKVFFKPGDD